MSKPRGRMQWDDNGAHLDEIVLTNVTFHIERMSQHGWWLGIHDPETGEHLSLWWSARGELVVEHDFRNLTENVRGPLLYHLGPWRDRRGSEHRCEVDKADHKRCRCECGSTRRNPEVPS